MTRICGCWGRPARVAQITVLTRYRGAASALVERYFAFQKFENEEKKDFFFEAKFDGVKSELVVGKIRRSARWGEESTSDGVLELARCREAIDGERSGYVESRSTLVVGDDGAAMKGRGKARMDDSTVKLQRWENLGNQSQL